MSLSAEIVGLGVARGDLLEIGRFKYSSETAHTSLGIESNLLSIPVAQEFLPRATCCHRSLDHAEHQGGLCNIILLDCVMDRCELEFIQANS